MVGVSEGHAIIQANLISILFAKLRGSPCRVFGSDFKLRVLDRIRYPDVFVACTAGLGTLGHQFSTKNPVVVFEILSAVQRAHSTASSRTFEYGETASDPGAM